MIRRLMLFLTLILLGTGFTHAQETTVGVLERLIIAAPEGYISHSRMVHWSPDSRFVALGFVMQDDSPTVNGVIWRVYDVERAELMFEVDDFVAWLPDSQRMLLRSLDEPALQMMDVQTGEILASTDNAVLSNREHDLFPSPDFTLLAVGTDKTGIQLFNSGDFSLAHHLDEFRFDRYLDHRWSPDGHQLVVTPLETTHRALGPIHIWTPGETLSAPIYNVTSSILWSPDGEQIAAPSDYTKVRFYDSTTGELLETLRIAIETPFITLMGWFPERLILRLATIPTGTGNVYIWDIERQMFLFDYRADYFIFAIENEDLLIVELPFGTVTEVDLRSGEALQSDSLEPPPLNSFSPDWRWLIRTISEPNSEIDVELYQRTSLEPVATFTRNMENFGSSHWSPDSRYFISVGQVNSTLWEIVEDRVG